MLHKAAPKVAVAGFCARVLPYTCREKVQSNAGLKARMKGLFAEFSLSTDLDFPKGQVLLYLSLCLN